MQNGQEEYILNKPPEECGTLQDVSVQNIGVQSGSLLGSSYFSYAPYGIPEYQSVSGSSMFSDAQNTSSTNKSTSYRDPRVKFRSSYSKPNGFINSSNLRQIPLDGNTSQNSPTKVRSTLTYIETTNMPLLPAQYHTDRVMNVPSNSSYLSTKPQSNVINANLTIKNDTPKKFTSLYYDTKPAYSSPASREANLRYNFMKYNKSSTWTSTYPSSYSKKPDQNTKQQNTQKITDEPQTSSPLSRLSSPNMKSNKLSTNSSSVQPSSDKSIENLINKLFSNNTKNNKKTSKECKEKDKNKSIPKAKKSGKAVEKASNKKKTKVRQKSGSVTDFSFEKPELETHKVESRKTDEHIDKEIEISPENDSKNVCEVPESNEIEILEVKSNGNSGLNSLNNETESSSVLNFDISCLSGIEDDDSDCIAIENVETKTESLQETDEKSKISDSSVEILEDSNSAEKKSQSPKQLPRSSIDIEDGNVENSTKLDNESKIMENCSFSLKANDNNVASLTKKTLVVKLKRLPVFKAKKSFPKSMEHEISKIVKSSVQKNENVQKSLKTIDKSSMKSKKSNSTGKNRGTKLKGMQIEIIKQILSPRTARKTLGLRTADKVTKMERSDILNSAVEAMDVANEESTDLSENNIINVQKSPEFEKRSPRKLSDSPQKSRALASLQKAKLTLANKNSIERVSNKKKMFRENKPTNCNNDSISALKSYLEDDCKTDTEPIQLDESFPENVSLESNQSEVICNVGNFSKDHGNENNIMPKLPCPVQLEESQTNLQKLPGEASFSIPRPAFQENIPSCLPASVEITSSSNHESKTPKMSMGGTKYSFQSKNIFEQVKIVPVKPVIKPIGVKPVIKKGVDVVLKKMYSKEKLPPTNRCSCTARPVERNVFSSPTMFTCQAIDTIDQQSVVCRNRVTRHLLVRAHDKLPHLEVCELHNLRLKHHQCCPICGKFCSQGTFLRCRAPDSRGKQQLHFFHQTCITNTKCPHCEISSRFEAVNISMKPGTFYLPPTSANSDKTMLSTKTSETPYDSVTGLSLLSQEDLLSLKKETILKAIESENLLKLRASEKCLYVQIKTGDVEKVIQAIANGSDVGHEFADNLNNTPLHVAAEFGSAKIIPVLIQAGAGIDIMNSNLSTPLMIAAAKKHFIIVKYLIDAGADVTVKDAHGMNAFHIAAKIGDVNVMNLLYETQKVNIDLKDDGGWTALVWACENKNREAVEWLMKNNADPLLRDKEHNIALHWAAVSGDELILIELLQNKFSVNALNYRNDSPLHIAARQDQHDCVKILVSNGANVHARNSEGQTPEMCAVPDTTCRKYLKKRMSISDGEKEWIELRDISKGKERNPIAVLMTDKIGEFENDFNYIKTICKSKKVNVNVNRSVKNMNFCSCQDTCLIGICSCLTMSWNMWYDKAGALQPDFDFLNPPVIFECNRMCSCSQSCQNRIVQHGTKCHFQIFFTGAKGWGVRLLRSIKRGTFVAEYLGELITDEEADQRKNDSYLFDLDNEQGSVIDALNYGNISRFFNHSCDPNIAVVKVFVDHHDLNFPHLALFSTRDINAGEELCLYYGEKFWIKKCQYFLCVCESEKCKYSKDAIDKTLEHYFTDLHENNHKIS